MTNNDLSFETIPLSIFENTNICGTIYHRILTSTKSFSVYVTLKRQHLSTNLKKHKLARFHTTQLMPLSPHARKSEIVLNSEFDAVDSVFQVRDSRFFVRGTGILGSKRKISCIPDSTGKNLLNSGIRITLHVATFGKEYGTWKQTWEWKDAPTWRKTPRTAKPSEWDSDSEMFGYLVL